ncbi:M20/M25/M40 family metallo-hydrolase [Patescibacteria group bacterium]
MPDVIERFQQYVGINTRSCEPKPGEETKSPSSDGQVELANLLKKDLGEIGIPEDWIIDFPDGSFLLRLPATSPVLKQETPHLAFAAHLDTYYGASGDVKPQTFTYRGGSIVLAENAVIPEEDLTAFFGKEIITSDGTSILGADDKAGVAALMSLIDTISFSEEPHGALDFWFCVDEEIGKLDIKMVPAEIINSWDILWAADGEALGRIDIGCFICRKVLVQFSGKDAHPGEYGHKLRPAQYAALRFMNQITSQLPEAINTRGSQGFCYITHYEGTASNASVTCMPRSFYQEESDQMTLLIENLAQANAGYYGTRVEISDDILCLNTREAVMAKEELLRPALDAYQHCGLEAQLGDCRGGTDGAMIIQAYPNLSAPNLGTGARNIHMLEEFLVVEELRALPNILLEMIRGYSRTQ